MADPRAINEFLTGEVEATTLLLGDFVDLDAQSGYTTYKMSVSDIGEVILEDIEYTQDLTTVDKTIIGAINENKSVIGYSYDEYDPTTAYAKNDLCIYNNVLYKAKQATTGNLPTNTTYWEETSIADEISELNSGKQDTLSETISLTRHPNAPQTLALANSARYGKICIISFILQLKAGTYYELYTSSVPASIQCTAMVSVGSNWNLITINGSTIRFNNQLTLQNDQWLIGELVYKG